jgi:hypothetical protein
MNTNEFLARAAAAAFAAVLATSAAARADGPLSVQIGPQFALQDNARNAGGDMQTDIGAGYDFLKLPVAPVTAALQADDAFGSHGSGNLNQFGFGVAGRLTTPIYAGAGISVYNVSGRLAYAAAPSLSGSAVGENFFIGDRVLSLPGGLGFNLQATYKRVPSIAGIDSSAFGVGLRVAL